MDAEGIFCPVCGRGFPELAPGPGGRPAASCPYCGSLERHRLLALLLRVLAPRLTGARVLDVAPSPHTTPLLAALAPGQLIGLDFDPAADGRAVDVRASITDLPFADDVVDFALCYHVFEHVPEDRRGMAELARVLAPTGSALVQVPWEPDRDTDEEVAGAAPLTTAERIRRFGQRDHVRAYGRQDVDERLREAGLEVARFRVADLLGPRQITRLGLRADEATWLVRPAATDDRVGDPVGRPDLGATVGGWVADLLGDGDQLPDLLPELVARSRAEVAARREVEELRAVIAARDGRLAELSRVLGEREKEITGLRADAARQRGELSRLRGELTRLRGDLARLRGELTRLRGDLAHARSHVGAVAVGRVVRAAGSALPGPLRSRLAGTGAARAVRRRLG